MRISVDIDSPFYWHKCPQMQVILNGFVTQRVHEASEEEGWAIVRQPDGALFKWNAARVAFSFTHPDGTPWPYEDARDYVETFQSRKFTYGSTLRQRLFDFASTECAEELFNSMLAAKAAGTPLSQELFDLVVHPLLERAYPFETREQAESFFRGK